MLCAKSGSLFVQRPQRVHHFLVPQLQRHVLARAARRQPGSEQRVGNGQERGGSRQRCCSRATVQVAPGACPAAPATQPPGPGSLTSSAGPCSSTAPSCSAPARQADEGSSGAVRLRKLQATCSLALAAASSTHKASEPGEGGGAGAPSSATYTLQHHSYLPSCSRLPTSSPPHSA